MKKPLAGVLRERDRAYALHGQGTPARVAAKKAAPPKSTPKSRVPLGKVGKAAAVVLAGKALYDASKTPKQKKGK